MKFQFPEIVSALFVVALGVSSSANASLYYGNGNTGFGGAIGESTLEYTDDGTTLYFDLTRGSGDLNDVFVLYLDTVAGGYPDNTGMTDQADTARRAISGCGSSTCSNVTFGLDADYAIVFDAASGASLFGLATGGDGSLTSVASGGGSGNASDPAFSYSFSLANLGLAPNSGDTIHFVGTYVSDLGTGVYLSNEGYGGLPGSNPGFSAVTFSSSMAYTTSTVPLPAAFWLFGSGLLGLIGIVRRKAA